MIFSDEQCLAAATMFENGAPLTEIALKLGCSVTPVWKCLIEFFGAADFKKLKLLSPAKRRDRAIAKGNVKPVEGKPVSPKKIIFSDEQRLAAAAAFEDGATMEEVALKLECSRPPARKCLIEFFGAADFEKLNRVSAGGRRAMSVEKKKLKAIAIAVQRATENLKAAEAVKAESAAKQPTVVPQCVGTMEDMAFRLSDITAMRAEINRGLATVTIEMDAKSKTFGLLCGWVAPKK